MTCSIGCTFKSTSYWKTPWLPSRNLQNLHGRALPCPIQKTNHWQSLPLVSLTKNMNDVNPVWVQILISQPRISGRTNLLVNLQRLFRERFRHQGLPIPGRRYNRRECKCTFSWKSSLQNGILYGAWFCYILISIPICDFLHYPLKLRNLITFKAPSSYSIGVKDIKDKIRVVFFCIICNRTIKES